MKADIYIAATLDGLIADEHGKTDWVKDDDLFEQMCRQYGCVAMGHSTFNEFGGPPFDGVQFIILAHAVQPTKDNVHFVTSAKQALKRAKELGCKQLLVIGGGQTNQAFLEAGLVAKVMVDIHSLTLGKGTPMFGDFKDPLDFELIANEWHQEGFMHAEYAIGRPQSVADLVEPEKLKTLASAGDYKQGKKLANADQVELEGFAPLEVTAKVGPLALNDTGHTIRPNTQSVSLRSTAGGLVWRCTCGQTDALCQHAVAAAFIAWQLAPKQA